MSERTQTPRLSGQLSKALVYAERSGVIDEPAGAAVV